MKDKLEKRNKTIHFIEKWLLIGVILFFVVQLTALGFIKMLTPESQRISEEQYEEHNKDYIGHWYDGTFFINMTVKENFESQDKYQELEEQKSQVSNIVERCSYVVAVVFLVALIVVIVREKKKKLLEGNTPMLVVIVGISYLIFKICEVIDCYIETGYWAKYSKGFLETVTYYPQMYYIAALPAMIIALGLLFRQKQRKDLKLPTKGNENLIKTLCTLIIAIGMGFILYRFGVRVYELAMTLTNNNINIRIPFYYRMMDLPREFASTSASYTKLVVLRFIKDLPVFIASAISVLLFVKILLSSIKGKIISKENDRRYLIIIVSLAIASIVLNVLGLFEVQLFNSEFLYQYKEAKYTIAIRSLSEPLFFAFFIYTFKHYIEIAHYLNKSKK